MTFNFYHLCKIYGQCAEIEMQSKNIMLTFEPRWRKKENAHTEWEKLSQKNHFPLLPHKSLAVRLPFCLNFPKYD